MLDGQRPVFLTVVSDKYPRKDFDTVRDARALCDEHRREGGSSALITSRRPFGHFMRERYLPLRVLDELGLFDRGGAQRAS